MRALKKYSMLLKRKLAYEEMLKDIKNEVLRELKKCDNGQAVVDEVEYHTTIKVSNKYPKDLTEQIKAMQEKAKDQGLVKTKESDSFDAYIPKSSKVLVLARAVPEFKKFFGLSFS